MTSGKSFDITKKLQMIEQNAKNHYRGPLTDSELSDLEDQVALAAAKVQSTESEVSYIQKIYYMARLYLSVYLSVDINYLLSIRSQTLRTR